MINVSVDNKFRLVLSNVFVPIVLESVGGEKLVICE